MERNIIQKKVSLNKDLNMKPYLSILTLIIVSILFSCRQESKNENQPDKIVKTELTILEKIANAHGYDQWKGVEKIAFTFNVDRNENHYQRSWKWNTKTNDVIYMTASDTIKYNRNTMDSLSLKTNAGFINDKFWLLAPFNLIWDKDNFTNNHVKSKKAPLSGKQMQKLTIVYGNEGGYTPGDAYDFYFEDDFLIKEWVFRKSNQDEPSMITTWESYKDTLGLKIATEHKNSEEETFNLYFDGILLEAIK